MSINPVGPGSARRRQFGRRLSGEFRSEVATPRRQVIELFATSHGSFFSIPERTTTNRHAASALSAALGFLATIVNSERAAGSGRTRPCSQLRNVAIGILSARANSVCVIRSCLRKACGGMTGAKSARSFPSWPSALICRRMSASVVASILARLMRGFIRRMFSIVRRMIAIIYAPSY